MKPIQLTVPEVLRSGAITFEERNALYGDNYKRFGAVMREIFPHGLPEMETAEDWNRFGVWFMVLNKVIRYAQQMPAGHLDSAHDAMVYAAMLEELTK